MTNAVSNAVNGAKDWYNGDTKAQQAAKEKRLEKFRESNEYTVLVKDFHENNEEFKKTVVALNEMLDLLAGLGLLEYNGQGSNKTLQQKIQAITEFGNKAVEASQAVKKTRDFMLFTLKSDFHLEKEDERNYGLDKKFLDGRLKLLEKAKNLAAHEIEMLKKEAEGEQKRQALQALENFEKQTLERFKELIKDYGKSMPKSFEEPELKSIFYKDLSDNELRQARDSIKAKAREIKSDPLEGGGKNLEKKLDELKNIHKTTSMVNEEIKNRPDKITNDLKKELGIESEVIKKIEKKLDK